MPQWFTIASNLTGYVLDVQGNAMSPGTSVVMYSVNGQDNQMWYQDIYSGVIRSKSDRDYVLDIDGDAGLCINRFDPDSVTQKLICGEDRIHTLADPGMVLDVADSDEGLSARVCLWEFNGGNNQVWSFNYDDQAYFVIRSSMNGLVLDVADNNTSEGADVVTWDFSGADNQLWYEDHFGLIRSKLNDFVLDSTHGDIVMNPFDQHNIGQGFAVLGDAVVNMRDQSQCLDISGNDSSRGAHMCQYEYKGSDNQHWTVEYI